MTTSEIIASYCVMVNQGSGVLVNSMSQEYSYVLTAGHVIKEDITEIVVTDHKGKNIQVLDILFHPDGTHKAKYDCGILKVAYEPSIDQKLSAISTLPPLTNLTLVGFPATERQSASPIKHYDGHITSVVDSHIILTLEGIPGKPTIKGMSGGGVYHVEGFQPYLIGIEYGMDGTGQEQQFGRVQCHGLIRFEEIIKENGSAPMVPAHLECFSRLREKIFGFNVVDQQHVARLKSALFRFADELIENGMPAPYKLMSKYETDLLIDSTRPNEVKDRELWVAYFEFLVICALLDNVGVVDDNYIQHLERRRRILYTSDGSNWVGRLEFILKAAKRLLDKDGTVIVASPEQGADLLPAGFHLDKVVRNISLVPNAGPLAPIDQAESALYKSFVLAHLEGIRKKCVVQEEWAFYETEAGVEQLSLFRNKLNEFVK
ncbi:hypothetical protein AOX56_10860 [Aeromonas sobria]|uniref:Uncharacterized protein n=1 Tax=Aeromonas sobria TaxID=646 RepID=A0A2N3J5Z9_AERSO|nr:ABC-three component system protein [Aeromonas sobria]PKQ81783.1 hypothetical protein AOX56_10860 [Aeromonas sobria]